MARPRPVKWMRAHPYVGDGVLAGVLMVLLVGILLLAPVEDPGLRDPNALAVLLVLTQSIPFVWRRRNPEAVLLVVGITAVVFQGFHFANGPGGFPVVIALYSAAAHAGRKASIRSAAYGLVGVTVALLFENTAGIGDFLGNYFIFSMAWILGDQMASRRARQVELEERALRAEREREQAARIAVADERARIARELHDVVAHSMSVMVVQAGAARRVMDTDPATAKEALASVEATGRQALDEMRRLLGVLRSDDAPGASRRLAPQPTVGDLDQLVAQLSDAGLPVDLHVEGEPRPLPSGVDLSAYRIVQEALTNTLKHAGPARADVTVRYCPDEVELRVVDNGRGAAASGPVPGGGQGLVGMRERVNLYHGQLRTGPRHGGGYEVVATLPAKT